ncbi:MAG: hypothetical protein ACRD7E_18770, partial [Bryobacteraceae bacterium]
HVLIRTPALLWRTVGYFGGHQFMNDVRVAVKNVTYKRQSRFTLACRWSVVVSCRPPSLRTADGSSIPIAGCDLEIPATPIRRDEIAHLHERAASSTGCSLDFSKPSAGVSGSLSGALHLSAGTLPTRRTYVMPNAAHAKFALGKIVATPGALEAFRTMSENPWSFLMRHMSGDWGDG